ncbi:MAG: hypothetical protein SFU99_20135 [Saprospiraceae bacterium]|nr:hypothetical protein [Saprospiraceae bacterium]
MATKRRFFQSWNLDKTLSLLAFLISLGTFFLLYYQTRLTQKQQYASVLPYLEIFNRNPRAEDYTFAITNNGIGPAFIEKVNIHYNGKTFRMDPANFLYSEIYPKDTITFGHTNLPEGRVISPGVVMELLEVQQSLEDARKLRALFGRSEAVLEVIYTSVYGEKWVVSSGNFPIKID